MKKLLFMLVNLVCVAPVALANTIASLFERPVVIGDSLSQGFYGVIVEKKTQDWAYPVLVVKQAGANLYYNELKGPYVNLEDVLKGNCGPICIGAAIIGGNERTYALPTHAGITGAQYTSVLRTSGRCEDITASTCKEPDKFHRFGLRDAGTQMQIVERNRPTFLFGTAAANHVLCTALHTSTSCLDEPRFRRDIAEVMRRARAMGSLRGGVLFTIPNVTAIAYLEPYRDPQNRPNYTGLKAFYRRSVSDPNQVLDANEVRVIENFLTMLNNEVKAQGSAMGFAVTDAKVIFDNIKANGRLIRDSRTGYSPGLARAHWPLPGAPGVFSLDGVHPNRYGHAVLANELIASINSRYRVNIPLVDEYAAWFYDSLNRDPVDIKNFLEHSIMGQVIGWLLSVFK
ncbi:MAG: hypothetical protein NZM25_11650 [Leptospiraceae bacterium]|nr:hypothetical protein [Leptospiraceae bacterium]MDW8307408.1 hypothetical protein [Leptospiraceae bacterium]